MVLGDHPRPDSTQNRGYAVSCEQALKELKATVGEPSQVLVSAFVAEKALPFATRLGFSVT
jgi:hypothetical protein